MSIPTFSAAKTWTIESVFIPCRHPACPLTINCRARIYEACEGNPESNARVVVGSLYAYVFSISQQAWVEVLHAKNLDGQAYK